MSTHSLTQIVLDGVEIRQDTTGRFNLNDLHASRGGADKDKPGNWQRLDATQRLIAALDEEVKIAQDRAIVSKQGLGTYGCLELVYDYAAWISPEFKIKVYRTFHVATTKQMPVPPAPALPGPVEDMLNAGRKAAEMLVDMLGVDRGMAISCAMSVVDAKLGTVFHTNLRPLLPAANDFREPTQIDVALGLGKVGRISATNALLQDQGYQLKDQSGAWVPSAKAIEGKHWVRKPFTKQGHSGVSLLWDLSLVKELAA